MRWTRMAWQLKMYEKQCDRKTRAGIGWNLTPVHMGYGGEG